MRLFIITTAILLLLVATALPQRAKEGAFGYRCSRYCSARHLLFLQPRLTIEVKP